MTDRNKGCGCADRKLLQMQQNETSVAGENRDKVAAGSSCCCGSDCRCDGGCTCDCGPDCGCGC